MPGSIPTPSNYSALVDEVVTQQFMRGEWDATKRLRKYWEKLESNRNIEYDASGKYIEWKVKLGEFTGGYRGDMVQRRFERVQHRATYTAPYSFLEIPAMLSERDLQFLSSEEALVKFQNDYLTQMGEDFGKLLNQKLLAENTTANTVMGVTASTTSDVPLYGLLTLFSHGSGTAQNYIPASNSTTGNVAATDKEVLPNSTYCGISTNPVTGVVGVGGQVVGSAAPVLMNWSHTGWNATAAATWLANAVDVLDYGITRLTRSPEPGESPDLVLMTRSLFLDTKRALRGVTSQQVVLVDGTGRKPNVGQYGDRMIPYNDADICFDENVPTGVVNFLNTKKIKYKIFPQRQLAGVEGGAIKGSVKEPFRVAQMPDIDGGAWKVVVVQCAQQIAQPYYQGAAFNFG